MRTTIDKLREEGVRGVKLARARKRYSFFRRAKALLALRALPPHQMTSRLRKA
jgi:hypothetical protein